MKNEVGFYVPVCPMIPESIFEMGIPNLVPAPRNVGMNQVSISKCKIKTI